MKKDKATQHSKALKRILAVLTIAITLGGYIVGGLNVSARTREEAIVANEYYKQGYDPAVANDQAAEDFGRDGECATGGIDGKLLNGTVAKNNTLGLSTTTTKPACTHDWVETDRVEATCKAEGKITYTCSKCGKEKTEKIAKADHTYVMTENVVGTCQEKATQTFTCSVCGETYTQEGEYGEHMYEKQTESVEPTCTEDGKYIYTCTVCGDTYEEVVKATGHDFPTEKTVTKEPTCTEDGTKAYICKNCGFVSEEEVIKATGHKEMAEPIRKQEPTFFADGYEEYACENCGTVLRTVTLSATGGVWRFILPIGAGVVVGLVLILLIVLIKRKRK